MSSIETKTPRTVPFLEVKDLSKRFGSTQAVDHVSFDAERGEIVSLLGPSGCGKSTLLRIIAGFETADSGDILINGQSVSALSPEKRDIGIVFQDYALFPHLRVIENIMFAMKRVPKKERREQAYRYISMVNMNGFEDRYPRQLSGGQQQRVALARSFAAQPRLILLDEPFSNLDTTLRQSTRREIRDLLKSTGTSIIFVTHDQEEALCFSDRLCVIQNGKLEQVGTPAEVYGCPVNTFVASFLGRTNFVRAEAKQGKAFSSLGTIQIENEAKEGSVLLSLRPEQLSMTPCCDRSCPATVIDKEFKGNILTFWVKMGNDIFQIDADRSCPFTKGDLVNIIPSSEGIVVKE